MDLDLPRRDCIVCVCSAEKASGVEVVESIGLPNDCGSVFEGETAKGAEYSVGASGGREMREKGRRPKSDLTI